jgi:hypothetical protein
LVPTIAANDAPSGQTQQHLPALALRFPYREIGERRFACYVSDHDASNPATLPVEVRGEHVGEDDAAR